MACGGGVAIRFDLVSRDPGRAKGIRRSRWPRARTVNEIPSGWTVFHCRPPRVPSACAPLDGAAAVGVVGDHSVAYTSRAPAGGPRLRFLGDASECLLPARRLRMLLAAGCTAHARRRPVSRACCRRSLVALVLHPVVLWSNHRRCDSLAEPMVAACLRHVPAGGAMYALLELAWHSRFSYTVGWGLTVYCACWKRN